MARRKSLRDLRYQTLRLLDASEGNEARQERIRNVYKRYAENLRKTKSMSSANERIRLLGNELNSRSVSSSRAEAAANEYERTLIASRNRKYSRRTYMGLANG